MDPKRDADVRTTVIETESGSFTVDTAGDSGAPLVLLLHGFPQSRHTWRDALPALARAGYRAVAPDQRGYSAGARPKAVSEYTTDQLVGDVLALADRLEAATFDLVGHDWGGQVAWLTAAHHPDRVRSLTVLSRPHPAAFARSFELDADQASRSGHHERFLAPDAAQQLAADDFASLRGGLNRSGIPASVLDAYLDVLSDPGALDAALNWYRAAALTGGLRDRECPNVVVPTLYLWGDADASVGATAARLTAEHVGGRYSFVEITGAGHFLTDDGSGAIVINALLEHLRGSSSS